MKKQKRKRSEIRIIDPSPEILDEVARLAEEAKRTISKQGEIMLEEYIRSRQVNKKAI